MIRVRLSGVWPGLAVVAVSGWLAVAGSSSAPPPLPVTPPPLPTPQSPIDHFRELLAMSGVERRQALTNRPPEVRARLLTKLQEYERMPADQRELRLRATELRWYLVPLMKTPAAQRPALATTVPTHLRKPVADRLDQWDLLPPEAQRELLENELAVDYFTQASLPPARRQQLTNDLQRWETMPPAERQRLFERVNKFFDLTAKEQEKAKATMTATEREQMERTLSAFPKLPREQRIQCIRSFEKFASMTAAERQSFLQNAARWSAMSPAERETWRNLVRRLPEMPPLPPDFYAGRPPPLPPSPAPRAPSMATNGN
jgi:hypothetical protein